MLDLKVRDILKSLPTPFLVDAMSHEGLPERHLDVGIRPATAFSSMVGSATTVKLRLASNDVPGDLMELGNVYRAKSESPGRIIVIEVPTELHAFGIVGDGAATMARRNGFVGALVEGAVRDTHALKKMGFPAFSRTISPGYIMGKASIASVGEPVIVGGQTIHEGDVIAADNDGVVVIRGGELDRLVTRALALHELDERGNQLVAEGKSWTEVDEILGPQH
jgi:4-hydroxy-4-methyl-2-oxoglutarate aldolase